MTKHLAKNFVDLSNRGFGSYKTAELHLNHGVNGFGVRPLVVVLHKDIPIEVIVAPHALPQTVKLSSPLTALRVALEGYEGDCIDGVDSIEAASAGICLISRHLVDGESLGSFVYQFWKLRSIGGFGWGCV